MTGRRFPDGEYVDEPGGYSKHVVTRGGVDETCWMVKAPNGGPAFYIGMSNSDGTPNHWVQENEDGTITVRPQPADAPPERRNSNSVKYNGWHGYIYDGVWHALPDSQ